MAVILETRLQTGQSPTGHRQPSIHLHSQSPVGRNWKAAFYSQGVTANPYTVLALLGGRFAFRLRDALLGGQG